MGNIVDVFGPGMNSHETRVGLKFLEEIGAGAEFAKRMNGANTVNNFMAGVLLVCFGRSGMEVEFLGV